MKKKKALSVFENIMIVLLIMTVGFVAWKILLKIPMNIVHLSDVSSTGLKAGSAWDSLKQDFIHALNNYSDSDHQTKVDVDGSIGKLIAKCNSTGDPEVCQYVIYQLTQEPYALNPDNAKKCSENPSSCESLMTVTSFSLDDDNIYDKVDKDEKYIGQKVPLTLTYTLKYVNNDGETVVQTINQAVFIQSDQAVGGTIKTVNDLIEYYKNIKFPSSLFTGDAIDVQNNINAYMNKTNSLLGKTSETQYIDFTDHTDGTFSGCTDKASGCGNTPDY